MRMARMAMVMTRASWENVIADRHVSIGVWFWIFTLVLSPRRLADHVSIGVWFWIFTFVLSLRRSVVLRHNFFTNCALVGDTVDVRTVFVFLFKCCIGLLNVVQVCPEHSLFYISLQIILNVVCMGILSSPALVESVVHV